MPTNIPAYKFEEYCHIAAETVYGTPAASGWRSFRVVSWALVKLDQAQPRKAPTGRPVDFLYAAGSTPGPREIKYLSRCGGRVVLEADWLDVGLILKNMLLVTPSQSLTTGVLTSTFAFPIVPVAMPQSLTMVHQVGSTFTAKDQYFAGCYVDKGTLIIRENEPVQLILDVIARDMTLGTAPAADLSPTPWMEFHEHEVRMNATPGATLPVSGDKLTNGAEPMTVEWMVDNALRQVGAGGQGGRVIRQPIPQGYRHQTLKITRDWSDDTLQAAYRAEGAAGYFNLALVITSQDNIPGGTPTTAFSLSHQFHAARVIGDPPTNDGGPDIVPEAVTFKAAFEAGSSKISTTILKNGGTATEYNDA